MAGSVLAALVRLPLVGTEHFIDHEQNEIYLLTSTGLLMEGAKFKVTHYPNSRPLSFLTI